MITSLRDLEPAVASKGSQKSMLPEAANFNRLDSGRDARPLCKNRPKCGFSARVRHVACSMEGEKFGFTPQEFSCPADPHG